MTRRAPLLAAAMAVLLTVAYWYLLYQPRRVEQARYVEETAQLETERGQLQAQIASLREIEANAEDYESQLTRLQEYIPHKPAQPQVLKALQQAADAAGVEIAQMTFSDAEVVNDAPKSNEAQATLARIPTQMTVDGGYFQVVDLLRRIEVDMARAIKVDTVTMAEAEETFPSLTITWSGHMFAVLPILEAAAEDDQAAEPSEGSSAAPAAPAASASPAPEAAPTAPASSGAGVDEGTS